MKKMKNILFLVLASLCCFGLFTGGAWAAPAVHVTVDGQQIAFSDAQPFLDQNSRTQVPVRALGEALGCVVQYTQDPAEVTLTKQNPSGILWKSWFPLNLSRRVDSLNTPCGAILHYHALEMDTQPYLQKGRTYLPARYVAEAFGYQVGWDAATKTVRMKTDPNSAFAQQQTASGITESTLQGTWRLQAVEENSWLNQAELSLDGNQVTLTNLTDPQNPEIQIFSPVAITTDIPTGSAHVVLQTWSTIPGDALNEACFDVLFQNENQAIAEIGFQDSVLLRMTRIS